MSKNIILCADGTGNKGGYTPSSNVYKLYSALDIHKKNEDRKLQIRFYDNGIGTEKNKLLRGLSGALGFGFRTNVCDLYEYLAKNYEPGKSENDKLGEESVLPDKVYIFGFSRGAATVRAFSGFIATCGLVNGKDQNGKDLDKDVLKDRIREACKEYKRLEKLRSKKSSDGGEDFVKARDKFVKEQMSEGKSHGIIKIEFLGVWDTVSSLGFPQKWDITGIGMFVLNALFMGLDYLSDFVIPHRFYNYELTGNVDYACQALAIDDERTSFWPMVWNENKHKKQDDSVDQVWFAGMHSNVGGGYRRAGMANVALEWMIDKAEKHGLVFNADALNKVSEDSDAHGRIYNSRDGFAIYYRYHPRDIQKLCRDKLKNTIKVHQSVIERMDRKTANYAPALLPTEFHVVDNSGFVQRTTSEEGKDERKAVNQKIKNWVLSRKWLYGIFLETTIVIFGFAIYFWNNPPLEYLQSKCLTCRHYGLPCEDNSLYDRFMGFVADTMNYFMPDFLNGLITKVVIQDSYYFWGTVILFISYWRLRMFLKGKTDKASEEQRKKVLTSLKRPE